MPTFFVVQLLLHTFDLKNGGKELLIHASHSVVHCKIPGTSLFQFSIKHQHGHFNNGSEENYVLLNGIHKALDKILSFSS